MKLFLLKSLCCPMISPFTPPGDVLISHTSTKLLTGIIAGQKEHLREISFHEEFILFLQKYGIEYDEGYIWK
jgi:hypothetical protein